MFSKSDLEGLGVILGLGAFSVFQFITTPIRGIVGHVVFRSIIDHSLMKTILSSTVGGIFTIPFTFSTFLLVSSLFEKYKTSVKLNCRTLVVLQLMFSGIETYVGGILINEKSDPSMLYAGYVGGFLIQVPLTCYGLLN